MHRLEWEKHVYAILTGIIWRDDHKIHRWKSRLDIRRRREESRGKKLIKEVEEGMKGWKEGEVLKGEEENEKWGRGNQEDYKGEEEEEEGGGRGGEEQVEEEENNDVDEEEDDQWEVEKEEPANEWTLKFFEL